MTLLFLALGFLTAIPVRLNQPPGLGDLGRAAAWFPLVGLFIGSLTGLAALLLAPILPAPVTAVILVALWAGLTGGLHLDGLADCGDGLLAAVAPERRLEIMRDPRLGTFGGMVLVLHLLFKASLLAATLPATLIPLLAAPVIARWLLLITARQPLARPGGLGADFAAGITWRTFVYAALVPLAVIVLGGWRALFGLLLAHLALVAVLRLARSRLGGVTGDVMGLVVELGETAVLLAFAARMVA